MGFAPMTNPQVVVVATLNGTHGEAGFGGQAAAPVFKIVAGEALRVFDVPKDLQENPATPTMVAKNPEDLNDLAIADLDASGHNILEEAEEDAETAVDRSLTVAGVNGEKQGPPAAVVAAAPPKPQGPRVPNFRGMTMRAVLAEAAARGLSILPDGSGIARVQSPPPGAPLHQGERIRVQFAR
jgi:cell division protein FtsI (penicillin-binding protein 3)